MTEAFDVEAAAEAAPDRLAILAPDDRVTFADLADRVGAVDVDDGDHVGGWRLFVARPTVDDVVRVLAHVHRGRPVALVHPRAPAAEQDRLRQVILQADAPVSGGTAPEAPMALFFTSGTTGTPKGAVLTRGAFFAAAAAHARHLGWREDDRWWLSIPVAHIGGFSILTRCLAARRAVVLAPDGRPETFRALGPSLRPTLASLVPTQLHRLLEGRIPPPDSLRAVLLGGASSPPALVARARDAGWPVLSTYGLTEACAQVATERPDAPSPPNAVGPPLDPAHVRVADGEIQVSGPAVMAGYLGRGREGFTADGWFRTGDRGAFTPGGDLQILGRDSDLVVTGGENVYPEEVEGALMGLPEVAEAAVFGVDDPTWGQAVAAAVVPASEAAPSPAALAAALRGQLAGFKVPRRWAIVEGLPRTASGKVRRGEARARFAGDLATVDGVPAGRGSP